MLHYRYVIYRITLFVAYATVNPIAVTAALAAVLPTAYVTFVNVALTVSIAPQRPSFLVCVVSSTFALLIYLHETVLSNVNVYVPTCT